MMMEMNRNGDDLDSDAPLPTKGKARTTAVTTKKKAAPTKKATSAVEIDSDDEEDDDEEDEEPAKPVKRTNRAAVLRRVFCTSEKPNDHILMLELFLGAKSSNDDAKGTGKEGDTRSQGQAVDFKFRAFPVSSGPNVNTRCCRPRKG
ncbi:hypothetical protein HETIRDRAFT_109312 [Heterobasidion irregulare TC 32-1]|uniref:Uncharacterized protein n=1 Tax=Heterobasidion irregulare (strain TC 32-1) TaxID=747525 RepID=W4JVZ6_HETIT|nr:uncharacterized protein HETIRDRAFT_109312 [Heterobasidion irregulare TC 32-1]ETW77245.1 hypothetical protein HETIRDRAFT_109312 [Heterobasidion irregulare TC 32-1]